MDTKTIITLVFAGIGLFLFIFGVINFIIIEQYKARAKSMNINHTIVMITYSTFKKLVAKSKITHLGSFPETVVKLDEIQYNVDLIFYTFIGFLRYEHLIKTLKNGNKKQIKKAVHKLYKG